MRTIKLLPVFFILAACTKQSQYPALTQQQMREDFEYTMQMLHDCGAMFHTKEYLTGINPFKEARSAFEANIDTVTTFEGFYDVMQRVLSCMCDQHTEFSTPDENIVHISDEIKKKNEDLWEWMMSYSMGGLPVKYIDGYYYCWYSPLTIRNRKNKNAIDTLPLGTKILGIDGHDMRTLEKNFITNKARWSTKDRHYVLDDLYIPFKYKTWQIQRPGCIEQEILNMTDAGTAIDGTLYKDYTTHKVEVFPGDVLYIRIPLMDVEDFEPVAQKLIQMHGFKPSKVIVDVRRNQGGSDCTWQRLLSLLIAEPFELRNQLVLPRSQAVADMLALYPDRYPTVDEFKPFSHQFLPSDVEFMVCENVRRIEPDSASLRYSGPIYLMVSDRIYSSTLAFLAAFNRLPNGISVGEPTGWYGGCGLNPFYFCMPNSRLTFRMEGFADFTDVQQPEDLLHDRVKVEIVPSIAERAHANAYTGERYSYEYMSQHDTVFKYVMAQ